MITIVFFTAMFCIGWIIGGILQSPRDRDPDWRRSFTHENINKPMGPPPLKLKRRDDYQPLPPSIERSMTANPGLNSLRRYLNDWLRQVPLRHHAEVKAALIETINAALTASPSLDDD